MTNAAYDDWQDWDDDEPGWPPGLGAGGLEDDGPDDDLPMPPGGRLAEPDDVLDFLLPLIGPERAGPMALWCCFVDGDDVTLPLVLPISDMPMRPDRELATNVVEQLRMVLEHQLVPDGGLVLAVVRRAGGDRGDVELAWVRALQHAADRADVRVRAIAAVGRDRARVLRW